MASRNTKNRIFSASGYDLPIVALVVIRDEVTDIGVSCLENDMVL